MPLESTLLTNASILNTLPERDITTRADQLGCLQPPVALRSEVNENGAPIDFLSDTVLGLPNPLEFGVSANRWQVRNQYECMCELIL